MNKQEFLHELEFLLSDLTFDERMEALLYYRDYFDEAGVEKEVDIILQLQSPERVAALIKAGIEDRLDETVEFQEAKFTNKGYQQVNEVIVGEVIDKNIEEESNNYQDTKKYKNNSNLLKALILVFCIIFILPVAFGIIVSIAGVIFSIFVFLISVGAGLLMGAIGIIIHIFAAPEAMTSPVLISLIGVILLLIGISLLCIGAIKPTFNLVKKAIHLFGQLIRKIMIGVNKI